MRRPFTPDHYGTWRGYDWPPHRDRLAQVMAGLGELVALVLVVTGRQPWWAVLLGPFVGLSAGELLVTVRAARRGWRSSGSPRPDRAAGRTRL